MRPSEYDIPGMWRLVAFGNGVTAASWAGFVATGHPVSSWSTTLAWVSGGAAAVATGLAFVRDRRAARARVVEVAVPGGVIQVSRSVAPEEVSRLKELWEAGQWEVDVLRQQVESRPALEMPASCECRDVFRCQSCRRQHENDVHDEED